MVNVTPQCNDTLHTTHSALCHVPAPLKNMVWRETQRATVGKCHTFSRRTPSTGNVSSSSHTAIVVFLLYGLCFANPIITYPSIVEGDTRTGQDRQDCKGGWRQRIAGSFPSDYIAENMFHGWSTMLFDNHRLVQICCKILLYGQHIILCIISLTVHS